MADSCFHIIDSATVSAAGRPPKTIREYIGRVASGDPRLSIALMQSPPGWTEPAQTPEFDEYSILLRGELHATINGHTRVVRAGQALLVERGNTVQYSTPGADGAEYIAVCLPAFAPEAVHRALEAVPEGEC